MQVIVIAGQPIEPMRIIANKLSQKAYTVCTLAPQETMSLYPTMNRYIVDFNDPTSTYNAITNIVHIHKRIDVLLYYPKPLQRLTLKTNADEHLSQTMQVFTQFISLLRYVVPQMSKQQSGRIFTFASSETNTIPTKDHFGLFRPLKQFSDSLRLEVSAFNIKVSFIMHEDDEKKLNVFHMNHFVKMVEKKRMPALQRYNARVRVNKQLVGVLGMVGVIVIIAGVLVSTQ